MARILILAVVVDLVRLAAGQAAPDVNNHGGAANRVAGEARLQGTLAGGGPADVVVYWGPTDGGATRAKWAHRSAPANAKNRASFSVTADNLIYGQTYYYRCFASNDSGGAWAPATTVFTTLKPRVGGYLAAKYGIATAYPACAGMASAATLTNAPVSAQAATSATLNATLACPGSVYDVRVYWGTTNGGTDAGLWENSATVGTWTDVASTKLGHTVTGLTPGAKYYFTFRGTNAVDGFWAGKVQRFRAGSPAGKEPGGAANIAPSPKLPVTKGLACWYDAAVGVTADSQGVIQTWKDSSGHAHHGTPGRGAPVLVLNQLNSKPIVQFRNSWLALAGTLFAKQHYLVIRSPGPQWSGPGGLLGRLKGRGSSYNTWGHDTGFWQDQFPAAVSRNGTVLPGPAFDCSPLNRFMVLKIVVNDHDPSEAS